MQCNERKTSFPKMDRCQEGYESPNQVLCCQCVVHVVKQDSPALPAEGQVTHHLPTCTTGRGQTCMLFQVEVEEDFGRRAAAGAAGASSLAQKRQAQAASESEAQGKQSPYFPGVFCVPWLLSSSNGEPSHPSSHPPQEEASDFTNDETQAQRR